MKIIKGMGIFLIVIGLIAFMIGSIFTIDSMMKKDKRIYTTATISNIERYKQSLDDKDYSHRVYVTFEADGIIVTRELNSYSSSYDVGDKIDIYYFADDARMAYTEGGDIFLYILTAAGFVIAGAGIFMLIKNRRQRYSENNY